MDTTLIPATIFAAIAFLAGIAAQRFFGQKPETLESQDVEWVVNDSAELGVKINGQFFWLYKGRSLVYDEYEDNNRLKWRPVGKREFGECCRPKHLQHLDGPYTEGEGWLPLPPVASPVTSTD